MGRRKEDAQFNMRLGRPLLKRLQSAARAQHRSVNSEILYRLEVTFSPDIQRLIGAERTPEQWRTLTEAERSERVMAATMRAAAPRLRDDAESMARLAERNRELGPEQLHERMLATADQLEAEGNLGAAQRLRRAASELDQEPELPMPRPSEIHRG